MVSVFFYWKWRSWQALCLRSPLSSPLPAPGPTPAPPRAIPPNTLARLASAERALGSQSLDTPGGAAVAPPGGATVSPLRAAPLAPRPPVDGFTISYSQSYARPGGGAPSPASPRRGGSAPAPSPPRRPPLPSRGESTPLPVQDAAAAAAAAVSARCVTPELAPDADGARGGGATRTPGGGARADGAPRPLFPIFRPLNQRKTVHILRHGESEFNAATAAAGSGFADPLIFDAPLTARGRVQATRARATLAALRLPPDALWVVSPLTRALETWALACPVAHRVGGDEKTATTSATASPHTSSASHPPFRVVVRADLAEHLATAGDVGTPASALREAWPVLTAAGAFEGLPERWWHAPHANCASRGALTACEPRRALTARVGGFRRWLQSVPERVIVCVGHSTHFGTLAGGGARLKNCEVHTMYV